MDTQDMGNQDEDRSGSARGFAGHRRALLGAMAACAAPAWTAHAAAADATHAGGTGTATGTGEGGGDICCTLYLANIDVGGDSTLFHAINRNKESLAIDLKDPDDLAAISSG